MIHNLKMSAELEQKGDLMQFDIAEIKEKIRFENAEDDNSNSVVEQWRRLFNAFRHILEDV